MRLFNLWTELYTSHCKQHLSTKNNEPKFWKNHYVAFVANNVLKLLKKTMNYIRELSYNDTLINRGRRMKAVHTPPLLPNLKTKTLTISNNHGFCSHSKRVKENDGPVILHMVICKIKGSLKPLMSFLIPHRNRRWWVGDPWNGQALRDIIKY